MAPIAKVRFVVGAALILTLPAQNVVALINLDGARNQIFVFGDASFTYDSNVFAESGAKADYTGSASVGAELKRRAGIISVNASVAMAVLRFNKYTSQNSTNPTFSLALSKGTGRTTGGLDVKAFRESRSDSAVNLRTLSWNFPVALSLKYPVSEKFYVKSATGYSHRRYNENSILADYTDLSEGLDVFYVYTSKLDLLGGYRLRLATTSHGTRTVDHSFTLGATGGIFAKINGDIHFGYQFRDLRSGHEGFSSFTTSTALTWTATRKLSASGVVSKDFMTTAIANSVDSLSSLLRVTYLFTRKFEVGGGIGYGQNRFLGRNVPPRRDTFLSLDASARYAFNAHLSVAGTYSHLTNWSVISFSDFVRNSFSFTLSSHF